MSAEPDIMTWFPRKEDYEVAPTVALDETYEEKLTRLLENIEATQNNIKQVVDGGNDVSNEQKIYRTMDVHQDLKGQFMLKFNYNWIFRDYQFVKN